MRADWVAEAEAAFHADTTPTLALVPATVGIGTPRDTPPPPGAGYTARGRAGMGLELTLSRGSVGIVAHLFVGADEELQLRACAFLEELASDYAAAPEESAPLVTGRRHLALCR